MRCPISLFRPGSSSPGSTSRWPPRPRRPRPHTHRPGPPGASPLTAELRLLPLLSTHLSHAEIAAELFVSPNTAKTHAVSIYRKLGVGARGQAGARARQLGLLEG